MKYPDARFRPLASGHQPEMFRYDIVCLHTMVGTLSGTDSMFHRNGWTGTESHFGVGGPWGDQEDGTVFQWSDTAYRADANLDGNWRVISIETGDNFPDQVKDIKPWTPAQLKALIRLVAWCCKAHDIPAVLIHDSKPTSRGIGFHQLGCEHVDGVGSHPDFLVKGGERWSKARGKECPGPERIWQVKNVIVPGVQAVLNGKVEADVSVKLTTQAQVNAMNLNLPEPTFKIGDELSDARLALWGGPGEERQIFEINRLHSKVDKLTELVSALIQK